MEKLKEYTNPEYYENRELSWIKFNGRVLNEARDKSIPLLERLKFVSITSSNLDEFFMVRVASLKDMVHAGYKKTDIAGMTASEQLAAINHDTRELVELLKKDYRLMSEEEAARLSTHFRSKVEEARRRASDSGGMISFYQVMKETLDYRKWFEFQLFSQKKGERVKELTNSVFGTFSGGEKAMSMYVPLFSAVVAKYQGGRADAPRLVSLDEAFAGVDNRNIRDMFRLMTEFSFDFIINSQVLWGDCDTLDALAIYQLIRPENAKFVTVMPYVWNGHSRELMESEEAVEQRRAEIEQTAGA